MTKKSEKRQPAATFDRNRAAAPALTKKQIARSRKESRQLRIIWTIVAAFGAVILAVLLMYLIRELIVAPNTAVAVVDGAKVPVKDFEDLLTLQRYNLHSTIYGLQQQIANLDTSTEEGQFMSEYYYQPYLQQSQTALELASDSVLTELIQDVLIQKKAQELGLSVTLEETRASIQESVRTDIESNLAAQASSITTTETISGPTPVPTAIPDTMVEETLQNYLTNVGLSRASYERVVQRSLLRTKVGELLASQVMSTGLMIHVQLIVTDTQEVADAAMQRIEAGEDFATVAKEVSRDSQVQVDGGDKGWLAVDQLTSSYGADLANAVSSQEIDTLAVMQSNGQFYVVRVVERNENGTLPEDVISQRKESALTDWLTAQTEALGDRIQRLLQPSRIPPDPWATASP
jgi:parvulin-like peptidyl-prolyl isomerase